MKKTTPTPKNAPETIPGAAAPFDGIATGPIDARTREALTHLLLWIAEGGTCEQRGLRATVMLYCTRPDLIGGATLAQIGEQAGCTRQAAHKIADDFRASMRLVP